MIDQRPIDDEHDQSVCHKRLAFGLFLASAVLLILVIIGAWTVLQWWIK